MCVNCVHGCTDELATNAIQDGGTGSIISLQGGQQLRIQRLPANYAPIIVQT